VAIIPEIQTAFYEADKALNNLEIAIRKTHATPLYNINPSDYRLFNVPNYYIRKREYYVNTFNLASLVSEIKLRDSIAYALMQHDFHNYIIYRVNIYGVVKSLFIKNAIINLVSIIEAMIISALSKLHPFCLMAGVVCKYNSSCTTYIKSTKSLPAKPSVEEFEKKIGFRDNDIYTDTLKVFDIRNNIHLSIIKVHEFATDEYSMANYKRCLEILNYLKDNLIPYCKDFHLARTGSCKSRNP